MDVDGPAAGSDEPLDRHTAAVSPKLVATLAAAHAVGRGAAIKLGTALSQPEQGGIAFLECNCPGGLVELQLLDRRTAVISDRERKRIGRDVNSQGSRVYLGGATQVTNDRCRFAPRRLDQRSVVRNGHR